jgi:hypothetical protein
VSSAIVSVIVAAVFLVLAVAFNEYIRRPKLFVSGGGNSKVGPHTLVFVSLRNEPSFLGVRFGETILFGHILHRGVNWGLTIQSNPAKIPAGIQDLDSNSNSGPGLVFRDPGKPDAYTQIVTLASGESAQLGILATGEQACSTYYYFVPDQTAGDWTPKMPPVESRFTSDRRFVVLVYHVDTSRKPLKIPVKMFRMAPDAGLYVEVGGPKGGRSSSRLGPS